MVITVASDGLRSSFNSVALWRATEGSGNCRERKRDDCRLKWSSQHAISGRYLELFIYWIKRWMDGVKVIIERLSVRPREDLHMCIHIHTMRFRRNESH